MSLSHKGVGLCVAYLPGKEVALLPLHPLRTVRESTSSYFILLKPLLSLFAEPVA